MLLAIVARRRTATNVALAAAVPREVDARILSPEQAASLLRPGAVALGRLDVVDGLDGVEDGLWALGSLAARGARVPQPRRRAARRPRQAPAGRCWS